MAKVVIVGAGMCGLGTALLLARDGHEVTVLERDDDPVPESPQLAWNDWARNGVAQFRQPHNFMPGLRSILEAELPDVQDGLRRAGASRFDLLHPLPPPFTDRSARAIDDQLWTYTARRPAGEWVFAHAAQDQARLTLQRGVQAVELITGPSVVDGTPRVVGVRTATGAEHRADLVVDAMGRASRSPRWLAAVGARAPKEEQADCGFSYYSRYFYGTEPERMAPTLMPLGTISVLTLPGDNGTWSVTLFTAAGDQPLKNFRHDDTWTRTVRACPLHAHWLDGEPITDVLAMSGWSIAIAASSSMGRQSSPASSRWRMRGRARTRPPVAVSRSASSMPCCYARPCALRPSPTRLSVSSMRRPRTRLRHGSTRRSRWIGSALPRWKRCARGALRRLPRTS